ncbi:MAG: DUF6933 domain-containing protein [Desertimonas sp.]
MFVVRGTKKLLDRVKQRPAPVAGVGPSMMGEWYATLAGGRPQTVVFVNETTLLPVLVPIAPGSSLLARFPDQLAVVLGGLGVPAGFVAAERVLMGEGVWAKTANRSVVGSMNEFVFLADAWRGPADVEDPVGLSLRLATVPCSPLYRSYTSPDRAVAAMVARWEAGEIAPPPAASASAEPAVRPALRIVPPAPEPHAGKEPVRNRCRPEDLSERDVEAALARIRERDPARAQEAEDVYGTLTWGEGPGQLSQSGVQSWLWYRLPTKYLTDEPGYMARLAGVAAELFDELGLGGYGAMCRSDVTAGVHAAFDRSDRAGFKALRAALAGSGIEPPDTASFGWGDVMGIEESNARSSVEAALEAAIDTGELVVGARGWRTRQQSLTDAVLDRSHPVLSGQSWRTAVLTERVEHWIAEASRRSDELGRLRARVANRLLHPVPPPVDVEARVASIGWLLQRFGSEQALTQAGYLNRAFVTAVYADRPWGDEFDLGPPRTETDDATLHRLRGFLQRAGALRKKGRMLQRTKHGTVMAADPVVVWDALVGHVAESPWARFVTETVGLALADAGDDGLADRDVIGQVVGWAAEMGWRTDGSPPSERDVSWVFSDSRTLLALCGLLVEDGDWSSRRYRLTPGGEVFVLSVLRATATGPRNRP